MSKIIAALIEAIIQKSNQANEITRVLNYLGYSDTIKIRIQPKIANSFIESIISSKKNDIEHLEDIIRQSRPAFSSFNRRFFYNEGETVSKKRVAHLVKVLERFKNLTSTSNRSLQLEIDRNGIHAPLEYKEHLEDLIFILKSGLAKLQEVTLSKLDTNYPFSIAEASSGEQAVVINILGIASQITDNSLICIDEPEICLHPEWQDRYIRILTSTFEMYRGCHFIIATHSPQIVANLDPYNSYIVSMETAETTNAKHTIKHSSDYQLANVFNYPGFKNEFLSRIALNTFAKVSKNKIFDVDDIENYKTLQNQSSYLDTDDPVLELFNALKEMYNTYG